MKLHIIYTGVEQRRNSLVSNAPSESSRSDLGTRGAKKGEDDKQVTFQVQLQPKNYYKNVSEHKEITKLVSLLSTSINSTKKVRLGFEVHL